MYFEVFLMYDDCILYKIYHSRAFYVSFELVSKQASGTYYEQKSMVFSLFCLLIYNLHLC